MTIIGRACDVLSQTLSDRAESLSDGENFFACDTCGDLPLNSLFVTLKREVVYTCPRTFEPLVIIAVANPDDTFWAKGVYRIGEFVIWHAGDLRFRGTVIPRSTLGLREIRTRATKQRRSAQYNNSREASAIAETTPEAAPTREEQRATEQLMEDYREATRDIRGHPSGLVRTIAIALIKRGWRKR